MIHVTLKHGVNQVETDTDATTVREVLAEAKSILNLLTLTGLNLEVNGTKSPIDCPLRDGDSVEVIQETKDKG